MYVAAPFSIIFDPRIRPQEYNLLRISPLCLRLRYCIIQEVISGVVMVIGIPLCVLTNKSTQLHKVRGNLLLLPTSQKSQLYSGLYFFRPQSPRKERPFSLEIFSAYGASASPPCPRPGFADLLKIENASISRNCSLSGRFWTFLFDMRAFTMVGNITLSLIMGKPAICCFVAMEKRHIAAGFCFARKMEQGGCSVICCAFSCWQQRLFNVHYR